MARQVRLVLRMSPGNEIILLDNSGKEFRVRITSFVGDVVHCEVLAVGDGEGEPTADITLYQGTLKGEKFGWVLQKGTELGVSTFVPLICQRSVPRVQETGQASRAVRWEKVIAEAAEQSGRCRLPQLGKPVSFKDACHVMAESGTSVIPWEREGTTSLRDALQRIKSRKLNILIGPEGGFEEWEVSYARSFGVIPVSLGRRILRSETAGIATVAAVLYEMGELGS